MKSKKKKNKQNILIAYSKSIASMQGIELAMLFCHAGFNVNTILLDNAENHISNDILKELTGHSPWSESHKPNWVKTDIEYVVCIIIEPLEDFQKKILLNTNKNNAKQETDINQYSNQLLNDCFLSNDDIFINYIKNHSKNIRILQKSNLINNQLSTINTQIIELPSNLLKIRKIFEKILSETVKLSAAKSLDGKISYSILGKISNIDYIKDLKKAFAEVDIYENENVLTDYNNYETARIIVKKEDKEIEIVLEENGSQTFSNNNRIYVSKHKNGLILIDSIETRLLPNFTCKSCFSRLVDYLKTILNKQP